MRFWLIMLKSEPETFKFCNLNNKWFSACQFTLSLELKRIRTRKRTRWINTGIKRKEETEVAVQWGDLLKYLRGRGLSSRIFQTDGSVVLWRDEPFLRRSHPHLLFFGFSRQSSCSLFASVFTQPQGKGERKDSVSAPVRLPSAPGAFWLHSS